MDTKLLEKKMESISPFELKNRLIDMADESLKKTARTMLLSLIHISEPTRPY